MKYSVALSLLLLLSSNVRAGVSAAKDAVRECNVRVFMQEMEDIATARDIRELFKELKEAYDGPCGKQALDEMADVAVVKMKDAGSDLVTDCWHWFLALFGQVTESEFAQEVRQAIREGKKEVLERLFQVVDVTKDDLIEALDANTPDSLDALFDLASGKGTLSDLIKEEVLDELKEHANGDPILLGVIAAYEVHDDKQEVPRP